MRRPLSRSGLAAGLLAGLASSLVPAGSAAQEREGLDWRDLVFTAGTSLEGYQGNLTAVTIPVVDSTDEATAGVVELGARGAIQVYEDSSRNLLFSFDTGIRQFAASGFRVRSYSPREVVGQVGLDYGQRMEGWGTVDASLEVRGRSVQDRPPMPMFLQPGYATVAGGLGFRTRALQGLRLDVSLDGEVTDYLVADELRQLDLLDRRSARVEAGAEWGGRWRGRVFAGYRWSHYPSQGTFDPVDPHRRDHATEGGIEISFQSASVVAVAGAEGVLNRSNSRRPEYDALRFRALLSAPLPGEFGLNLYAVLTDKSYRYETDFARLVPGEEADNASLVYLYLTRPLSASLDGGLRLGWTRAETDVGASYFRRYGATFLLHYRPFRR